MGLDPMPFQGLDSRTLLFADKVYHFMGEAASLFAEWNPPSNEESPVIASLWAKLYTTYQALYSIAKNGFGYDALVLARTIFEDTVNLGYVAKDPAQRMQAFKDYAIVEAYEAVKLMNELYPGRVSCRRKAQAKAEAEKAIQDHGYKGKGWSGKDLRARARDIGPQMEKTYYQLIYPLSSQYAHAGTQAVSSFWNAEGPPFVLFGPHPRFIEQALWTGAALCLVATEFAAPFVSPKWLDLVERNKVELQPLYTPQDSSEPGTS